MADEQHSFHIADFCVFGSTIAISIGIGIYYALSGGRQKTTSEYLVAGRTMKFLPVAISLMVSFESSIMMLGLPAEAYVYGVQWWISTVGFFLSQLAAIVVAVPLLHPLGITSAYEYLEIRFKSRAVRLLGSFLGILTNVWYMGIVLFGPAIALEAVTGFPQWGSIFIIAFVAVIYTTVGGLKAVIWTDVFQAFVMYAGMLAILIKGTIDVGSPKKVWDLAYEGGRLNFFNFDFDPRTRHTFWNLFVGTFLRGFGLIFNQSTVQRISSTKTQKEAKWMMMIMAPCFFFSLSMAIYEGLVAYAYYDNKGCDPLGAKKITDPNQIIPFTVMDLFKSLPGMPGLFLASLFSASLSTLSSGLSSVSALLWTDFFKPHLPGISELKATIIAKISVVVCGMLASGVALLVSLVGGPLTQIAGSLLSAFGAPLTGLFLLGCFFRRSNAKGALVGGLVSMAFTGWLGIGKSFTKSVARTPWLAFASSDKCWLNDSTAALMAATTTSGYVSSPEMVYGYQGPLSSDVYGVEYHHHHTLGMYSSSSQSLIDMTTSSLAAAAAGHSVIEAQGIQKLYTLSYMWFAPIGLITTMLVGNIVSWATGGTKEEVDPRYLLSFTKMICMFVPKPISKLFSCTDGFDSVKSEEKPPIHDMLLDKEIIISPPAGTTQAETQPMLRMTEVEVDKHKIGSGENDTADQNGGNHVRQSSDYDNGYVTEDRIDRGVDDVKIVISDAEDKQPKH